MGRRRDNLRAVKATDRWRARKELRALTGPPECEIRFRRDFAGGVHVEYATSTFWFAQHELGLADSSWDFDGEHVSINAVNGKWVWKLTGKKYVYDYGPDVKPVVMLEGIRID
ncbi:hypothetical protein [Mycobacterium kiyosense]|uniref:hypothetical protein n=1 Tax=Mycobacterium kiyosense TaxID=2871094 RepID=UPI00222FBFFE|nr:hypothetical protein [Mycobacterium kiyosense]